MGTAPQEMPTTITTPWVRLLTTVVGDLADPMGTPADNSCRWPSGSLNCQLSAEMP